MNTKYRSMRKAALAIALTLFAGGAAIESVYGQTVNQWTNGSSDGLWTTTANWSLNHTPATTEPSAIGEGDTVDTPLNAFSIYGTVNISGGAVTFRSQDINITNTTAEKAVINQSGGTVTITNESGKEAWFNIGERNGYGYYNLTGGTLDASKTLYFCLGRYGKGYMTVSGDSTVFKANGMSIGGYSAEGTAGSKLTIESGSVSLAGTASFGQNVCTEEQKTYTELKGGTLTVESTGALYIGNAGAHQFTQDGGTFNATGDVTVAAKSTGWGNLIINKGTATFNKLSFGAGAGRLTVSGGEMKLNSRLSIAPNSQAVITGGKASFKGVTVNSSGNAQFQVSGGEVTISDFLSVGNTLAGDDAYAVVLSGGTTAINNTFNIGTGSTENPAKMLITGNAIVNLQGVDSFVGNDSGAGYYYQTGGLLERTDGTNWFNVSGNAAVAKGYAYITGGELKMNSAAICVGRYAQGVMEIDGATAKASAKSLYVGHSPYKTQNSSLTVKNGGTLIISDAASIGGTDSTKHTDDATMQTTTMTVDGGVVKIGASATVGGIGNTVLNITGSATDAVPFTAGSLVVNSTAAVNFFLAGFKEEAGVASSQGIKVNGKATISGAVTVDTSKFAPEGAVNYFGTPTFSLLDANSLTWSPSSVSISGPWEIDIDTALGDVDLVLDPTKCGSLDFGTGNLVESALGQSGWILLNGAPNSSNNAQLIYSGGSLEDASLLAEYITTNSPEGVSAQALGDSIEIFGVKLDGDGKGALYLNIQPFNQAEGKSMAFSNVPEPSSWALLILGVCALGFIRTRKSTVGGASK